MHTAFLAADLRNIYGVEVNEAGDVNMALQHKNKSRIQFRVASDSDLSQGFIDKNAVTRVSTNLLKDGGCGLVLFGPDGNSKTGMLALKNGAVVQTLHSSDGTTTVGTTVSSAGGAVRWWKIVGM